MASSMTSNVLFFGDQTVEKLPGVRALAQKAQTSEVAARFLQAAADAIQCEVRELPAEERADVDDFDTILGLAEANAAREEPNETIATALMAVVRLGELIISVEQDATILGTSAGGRRAEVLSLCTGQLPGAVAVAARNSSELFALAVETTRIAFRLGREICANSRRIDSSGGQWATTLVGLQVEHVRRLLDEFHAQTQVPRARQICIGVEARGWLTLFGPPSTQARLWGWSRELAQASRIPTEARGGVHMATAPPVDTARVLGTSALLATPLDGDKARMYSPVDGALLQAATFGDLLLAVFELVVHQPIRFHAPLDAVIQALPPDSPIRLLELGPSGHTPAVQREISERGFAVTLNAKGAAHAKSAAPPSPSAGLGLRAGSGAVAIVGMAGRFPGAGEAGVDGFWDVLRKGERHVTEIPKSRFDLDTYYDATGQKPGSTLARHGAFLDRPGLFDHRLFNVSPREAMQMDPVHRLLLTTSYEALESAGYYPDATPSTRSDRIATYLGQASDDHREILANEGVDIYYIPGIVRAFGPGRLNYHFKWGGGAFAVDSACATSITATVLACRALLNRDCDTALAGAGSVLSSPWPFAGLSRGGFLSLGPGGCNTFHDDADGYTRGEAVGVVVLKRLEDALADNDNILGVIPGGARNYSSDASSITHPSAAAQQRLYNDILHKTATDPTTVSYVEMHGTGTQAGDNMEMSSVLSTFGRGRTKEHPLVVGAVKANIGHGEAAAGISSLLKVLLMLRERRIPPQPGVPFKVNSKFPDLDRLNVRIATQPSSLQPAADGKRRAFVNSFDAAGGNSCVLIEEAPPKPNKTLDPRPCHVVTLSARTAASLSGNRQRLLDYLNKHPAARLADIAYTTTARRMHGPLRAAFVVDSTAELADRLSANVSAGAPDSRGPSPNVVFTFTGQGSLYAGMGKDLWLHSLAFRRELEPLQTLADLQGLPKFIHLIAQGDLDVSTASPAQSQLAIVSLEIALARLFLSLDVRPSAVVGHSLGEYAALCVAGVLSMSDTLHLVATRAAIMEKKLTAHEYAMLAVAEAEPAVRQRLDSGSWSSCEIACINAPNMTVISGTTSHVESLQAHLKTSGVRSTLLPVPYGFHSKQLEPILDDFEQSAQGVIFSEPTIPIGSTLLGEVVVPGSKSNPFSPNYLRRQAREPVAFVPALEACKAAGLINDKTVFLEVGPEPICNGLVRATLSVPQDRLLASLKSKDDDWTVLSTSLATLYSAGISVKWPEYHKDFVKHLSLLDLPHYAFDEKEFWVPFREKAVDSAPGLVSEPATKSAPLVAGFPTTSLQRFKSTSQDGDVVSFVFESDPYEPDLFKAIRGHTVAGVTICPSSIFCDMALSVAKFAHQTLQPKTQLPALSISDLAITHPLVVSEKPREQTIEISARIPDSKKPAVCVVTFKLRDETGIHNMGGCSISYEGNGHVKKTLSRELFFVRARIEALQQTAKSGLGHRLFKPVVYSLFQNLVDYAPSYQGLEEVVLDGDFRDVVGTVKLPANSGKGSFMFKAHLLDAVVHLAGWFLNCGLKYPKDTAFLSIGIDKWHLFQPLLEEETYTSYVRMEETQGGSLLVGDVYVFSGDTLVCVALGVQSKKMKKATLVSLFHAADPTLQQRASVERSVTAAPAPAFSHKTGSQSPADTVSSGTDLSSSELASSATSVSENDAAGSKAVETLLAVVAAETGTELAELTPDVAFADLGVDSLMVISVIAAIRNETGVEYPGSFFFDHPTVGEAVAALGGQSAPGGAVDEEEYNSESINEEEAEEEMVPEPVKEQALDVQALDVQAPEQAQAPTQTRANVILMHGSPSSTETPVFILADATGAVSSFMTLPALAGDRKVYGIETPFAREGSDYDCSVQVLAESYAAAIRETHPSGPYLLVGFSAGAVHAFEVCRHLSSNILSLVLIDMPAPAGTALAEKVKLPTPLTLDYLQQSSIFTTRASAILPLPKPRQQHLCATVKSLLAYDPSPLPASAVPQHGTILIAGTTGPVLSASEDANEDLVRWARGHWDDEADDSKGWAALVGGPVSRLDVQASHAEMFAYPKVRAVAGVYKKVVEEVFKAQ
ncbi:hypothetical protein N0V95_002034 [Ascochyta clinopodiicola]|nr:hypothetical protein N0V95_002034 [Ascochyta clinopodiicola]